jgi:hypothetical protein
MSERDKKLIAREFEYIKLPKDKRYLFKYFQTPLQKAFVKYMFVFNDYKNFSDHTGHYCQEKWLRILTKRLRELEKAKVDARANMDLELLAIIESGKYPVDSYN